HPDSARFLIGALSLLPISTQPPTPNPPVLHRAQSPLVRSARLSHFDRVQRALEFFLRQNLFLAGNFSNCPSGLGALLCNFSSPIITDFGGEAGHHRHGEFY